MAKPSLPGAFALFPERRYARKASWITTVTLLCLCSSALVFVCPFPQRGPHFDRARVGVFANVAEAVESAVAGPEVFPPPNWIRFSTVVASDSTADRVAAAIASVSEGLKVNRTKVEDLLQGERGNIQQTSAWKLSVWTPPRTLVLVSGVMGEAVWEESLPMLLVEGSVEEDSDNDSEPEYFLCTMSSNCIEELKSAAGSLVERGAVSRAILPAGSAAQEAPQVEFHTTKAGREMLEQWLAKQESGVTAIWTPVGGNGEYMSWMSQQIRRAG